MSWTFSSASRFVAALTVPIAIAVAVPHPERVQGNQEEKG